MEDFETIAEKISFKNNDNGEKEEIGKHKEELGNLLPKVADALSAALDKGNTRAVEIIYKALNIIGKEETTKIGSAVIILEGQTPVDRFNELRARMKIELKQMSEDERRKIS